jgi:leucyl aminopeptidase
LSVSNFKKESTTTRTAGGLDFAAIGGKRQGRKVPQSLKTTRWNRGFVQPCANHPVWQTQSLYLTLKESRKMLRLKAVDLKAQKIDTLIVPVCEDKKIHDDRIIHTITKKALKLREFKAAKGDAVTFYDLKDLDTKRVILGGLGKLEKIDHEALRAFCGAAVNKCMQAGLEIIWIAVPAAANLKMDMPATVEAMMEGACLGNHLFNKYKKEKEKKPLKQINFLVKQEALGKLRRIAPKVSTLCAGTILAREWISTPSNEKTPEQFTRSIVSQARKHGLKARVLREKDLKQNKFGALLAVAAGSQSKPSTTSKKHWRWSEKGSPLTPEVSISRPVDPWPA